ncbi:pilin [Micromonospora arida]|uniref:pilin n=1 Tax=Micromonospora TaxID=1873 RepID=UPI0022B73740|nr:pilin [Micromonospora sp. WMMC250]MCZ7375297.1 pilin [Micromonospora sp. WMMC250]
MRRILNRLSLSTTTNASVLLGLTAQAIAGAPDLLAVNNLPTVINNLVVWIVGILVGVATLFLTYGGALYLMAGGDPGQVEKAKGALKGAATGYALAVLAPVLVTILRGILGT